MVPLLLLSLASLAEAGFWTEFWSETKTLTFRANPNHFPSHLSNPQTTFSTLLFDADDQKLGLVRTLAHSLRNVEPNTPFVVFTTEPLPSKFLALLEQDAIVVRPVSRISLPWKLQDVKTLIDLRSGLVVQKTPVPEFHANWGAVFSKLELFAETDFEQLVVLDYDILVQQPLSPLVASSCPVGSRLCMLAEDTDYGNGGFLVIRPSEEVYADLVESFEALRASGIVLKYAEQDFWNIYGAAARGFLTVMQLPNNCPGHCGNFLAPLPADCYLTAPDAFPALHFCGAAKPTLCTRTATPGIWSDFCATPAASKWMSLFYGLSNPCGDDQTCAKIAPSHVSVQRKFELAVRARHHADLAAYAGPTGGCCGEKVCIPEQFPETNCTDLGGTWNAAGVNCTACGLNSTTPVGTIKTQVDLSNSGLSGAILVVVSVFNHPALPGPAADQRQVLTFTATLIVAGEIVAGGQLDPGSYIEALLYSDANEFTENQDLFIWRFDEEDGEWVNAVDDCDPATAKDPVFVPGTPNAFQVRICHLSDFAVTLVNSTDSHDKPVKKKSHVKQKTATKLSKPDKKKAKPVKEATKAKKGAKKATKDAAPKAEPSKGKGKKVALGVGAGLGATGVSAGIAGLAVWTYRRRRNKNQKQPRNQPTTRKANTENTQTIRV